MHGGKHGDNIGTLETTSVCGNQVEEIPWGEAGVEGFQVSETPEPSVFNNLEDEGSASHFTGSDERLGGKPGGPFLFHIFLGSIGGIVFDAGVLQIVGDDHAVEDHGCPEQAFVGCISED